MLLKFAKKPWKLIKPLGDRGYFKWMSDKSYIKLVYKCETGKWLNLKNPKDFNEKLQWLKIYDRNLEYSTYVDKSAVRKFVSSKIGEGYLIPLIATYEDTSEIQWDSLPNKFVLKCTHGSHCHIICTDKTSFDFNKAERKLQKWLNKSWYWFGREWPYRNVKPKIICEEFISELNDVPTDYKIMCFHGKPQIIQVHKKSISGFHTIDFYNTKGDILPIKKKGFEISGELRLEVENINELLKLASILAEDIKYLRADFYNVNGKIYFGEMTFYDSSGFIDFEPEDANIYLGNLLSIN